MTSHLHIVGQATTKRTESSESHSHGLSTVAYIQTNSTGDITRPRWKSAMLARVLAMAVCLSVCLSVTSRCSVGRDGRSNLVLARGLLSTSPTLCFQEIQVSTKVRIGLVPSGTPDLENFATAYGSSNVLSISLEKDGRSERDKLDRRRSTKLIIPSSSDARPLQFIAEIVQLCLQHDFVARVS